MNETGDRQDFRQIQARVADLRDFALDRLRHEAVVGVLAASALTFFFGVALFVFVQPAGWMRLALLGLWLGSAAGTVWWRYVLPVRRDLRDLAAVSAIVEAHFPELRNDVTAALQFGEELEDIRRENRFSVAMVEGLLSETRGRLEDMSPRLTAALPAPRINLAYGLTIGAMVSIMALSLLAPGPFRAGVRGLVFGPPMAAVDDSLRRASIVGDIHLHYTYPEYTGLPRRTVQNSTGDIEVLKGTEVGFEAVALKDVEKVELIIEGTSPPEGEAGAEGEQELEGPRRVLLQRRSGGRLVANFSALRGGTYTIEAELVGGERVRDGIKRDIRIIPDAPPTVRVLSPEGEVDVSPGDALTFRYEASDDFGLMEIAIVTAFSGDEKNRKRVVVQTTEENREVLPGDARPTEQEGGSELTMEGETTLDLAPLNLRPKDVLVVYIEAVDNDAIAGLKLASSSPVILRVSSPEDKHLEIIEDQEKIFEALLDLLGDYLEAPLEERYEDARGASRKGIPGSWTPVELSARFGVALPPLRKAGAIFAEMFALIERMAQDPLMLKRDYELFKRTHKDLEKQHGAETELVETMRPAAKNNGLTRPQLVNLAGARQRSVYTTERAIITIEDLIASQRMENAMETAKDLKEAVERLKELMKKYKETQDPALKEEIMREMQRLRARMQELMQKMASQIKNLPQEHMNMEAMDKKGMMNKAQDANDSMEDLLKALEEGDIEKSMELLEQMSQSVDDMLAQMENDFGEMQPDGLSALDKRVSELMDELNNIQEQEEELAKQTQELNREMAEAQRERMEKELDDFVEKELEKVRALKKRLDEIDLSALDPLDRVQVDRLKKDAQRLEKSLEQKDLAESLEEAKKLAKDMKDAETSLNFRNRFMSGDNAKRKAYKEVQSKVRRGQPKANEIVKDLSDLLDKARPKPSPGQSQQLQEMAQRQEQIRDRAEKMRQELGEDGEFPMLSEELSPGLEEATKFMEGAGQRLRKGEGKPAHENEKLAMDKIKGLKKALKKAMKEEKMGQGQKRGKRMSKEKVEIPGESRRAPKEFREDIMDAMKEDSLEEYQDELKQYYESLVR